MTTNEYLGQYGNTLCVVYEDSAFSEAKIYRHYWPIAGQCVQDWKAEMGEKLLHYNDGVYTFRNIAKWPAYGLHRSVTFRLANGGQTKPIHTDILDYPCSKVRKGIETRYRNGQWEKLLKSKGWVNVNY